MIFYILGMASGFEALFLLLPILVSLIYGESVLSSYLISCGICALFCGVSTLRKPKKITLYTKEGLVAVALVWIWFSVFGAVPFMLTGEIPNFFDAFFEVSSGFTTTGASILTNVEALSRASLFWRSFTHWVGGMGILVFILAFIPNKGNGTIVHLMKAESPGPNVSKLVPKIRYTAAILYAIYFGMTLIQIILLLISKMPLFDTLCITFGTAGTGGFSIKSDGCAGYTMLQQGIITTFMILFGVNFTFYFCILKKKIKQVSSMTEVWAYLAIIAASILAITFNISGGFSSLFQAFHHAAFQVGSIITTTGFSTVDFNQWPGFSRTILVTLIKRVRMEGRTVETEVIRSGNAYLALYMIIFLASVLIVSLDEKDLVTNFTAVAATLNNVGPGLGLVGPAGNFSGFSNLSKLVLSFDMLAGRLELIPMLMIFVPSVWSVKRKKK